MSENQKAEHHPKYHGQLSMKLQSVFWTQQESRNTRKLPVFPLKFMIYFLIVVTVGGTSGIFGPFLAALILGIADVAGKYYVPSFGAFAIYFLMIAILILRPNGLFARGR